MFQVDNVSDRSLFTPGWVFYMLVLLVSVEAASACTIGSGPVETPGVYPNVLLVTFWRLHRQFDM